MDLFALFTNLPSELRIRIYEAHFEQESEVEIPTMWHERHGLYGTWKNRQPPITRINCQIRAESLPTFYGLCTFRLWRICAPFIADDVFRVLLEWDSP